MMKEKEDNEILYKSNKKFEYTGTMILLIIATIITILPLYFRNNDVAFIMSFTFYPCIFLIYNPAYVNYDRVLHEPDAKLISIYD